MKKVLETIIGKYVVLVGINSEYHVYDVYKDSKGNYYGIYAGNENYSGEYCEITEMVVNDVDWILDDWTEWEIYLEQFDVDSNDYLKWVKSI